MLKKTLTAFTLSFLSLLGSGWENCAAQPSQKMSDAATGTLQKMIVENGSVTLDLDLNGLNGSSSLVARPVTLHFAAAANSFFTISGFQRSVARARTRLDSTGSSRGQRPRLQQSACGVSRIAQATRNRKTSFGCNLLILPCATARTGPSFLTSTDTSTDYDANAQLAEHHRRKPACFKRIRQCSGPPIGRRCAGWKNLARRDDATDRGRDTRQRRN